MNLPLLSFIAHLKHPKAHHILYRDELTQRQFPCVLSNDLNPGKEFPACSIDTAAEISKNRIITITNPSNSYFIYFIDEVSELGVLELGYAIGKIEHICLIGPKRHNTYHFYETLNHYSDWNNFISRRFFA